MRCKNLIVRFGERMFLNDVSLDIRRNETLALLGPSGSGKSTLLKCLNRLIDTERGYRVQGCIELNGEEIRGQSIDGIDLRARVGMVFQKPNPFPTSIFENIALGLRLNRINLTNRGLHDVVEAMLRRVGLWREVKDRLHSAAATLSPGQQQRLCIARLLALSPEIILMDEPCSALDPVATATIERLIGTLQEQYTIVMATHSPQRAARVSRRIAFMWKGRILEIAETADLFTRPRHTLTEEYISHRHA